jgi:hypothetical protein
MRHRLLGVVLAAFSLLPWGCKDEACDVVLASDYDQSCTADTDCAEVGQVATCPAGACDGCAEQAVNKTAQAAYQAVLDETLASVPRGEACSCPCDGGFAICRNGKCQAASCGPDPADTLPACANAHGRCSYASNTSCDGGTLEGCAYSDEICCPD